MPDLRQTISKLQTQPSMQLVMGLGLGAVVLFLGAILGAIAVSDDTATSDEVNLATGSTDDTLSTLPEGGSTDTTVAVDPNAPTAGPGATTGPGVTVTPGPGGSAPTIPTQRQAEAHPCAVPKDSTGVTAGEIKWALHAPVTFDGQPLNLAEDPLEGVDNYIKYLNNNAGGINGRKINYRVFDDRYTVDGASGIAGEMVAYKPFFISGTLGVDQVAVVASEARKRGIPYMAAGGSEGLFKDICMFQIAASYDTHLEKLADFLAVETKRAGSPYFGKKKVGVTMLDSKYIAPSVNASFKRRLESHGFELVKVVTIIKPTQQTTYGPQIQALKSAGAEIVVPAQDPISTGRMTAECSPAKENCQWMWAFSNFAHESDTALQLQGADWATKKIRGLSGGCYYMPSDVHNPYDESKCAKMKQAHDEWVAVSSQSEWEKDGQGGASGYQIVHFWMKALRDVGSDVTRDRFFAALLGYNNYNDLVSGPITFLNSPNLAHGATRMVPFEAQSNLKWKQLTPGFVDQF